MLFAVFIKAWYVLLRHISPTSMNGKLIIELERWYNNMNCFSCKGGNLQKELKTYVANLDACVIIVKNVPSLVCQQCGDVYYTNDVMKQLEKIVDTMENLVKEVAIVEYPQSVA